MRVDDVRALALGLPGTSEQPHFDLTSFRVGTKIFATVPPSQDVVRVFVGDELAEAVVQEHGESVELLWWGKKLSGVQVRLAAADPALVHELITEAWLRKAPRTLVAEHERAGD